MAGVRAARNRVAGRPRRGRSRELKAAQVGPGLASGGPSLPEGGPRSGLRPEGLGLRPARFFFREVGAAVAGVGEVAVPAGAGTEHELHAARVAGADRALDQLVTDRNRLATHRT